MNVLTTFTTSLEVRDLSVSFDTETGPMEAVNGISFDIPRGTTVALVGESGSGKSASAMALLNLLPESATRSGTAVFREQDDLLQMKEPALRNLRGRNIGVVFQEPMTALNPVYTIGQQLRQALTAHERVASAQVRQRSLELLRAVQIPQPEEKLSLFPHQLSGGQRQRAMIAMALVGDPELLIADEPTTALDVTVQAEILQLLRELRDTFQLSILIITHNMGVVADIADQVIVMRQGEIVESAPVEELFANPQHVYTKELIDTVPHLGEGNAATAISTGLIDLTQIQPLVTFHDVEMNFSRKKRKEQTPAVNGVNFAIASGEVVALVGESGSGKSTIGRLASGLLPPTGGSIEYNPTVFGEKASKRTPQGISMIFQDPASSLNPRMTIEQSIVAPLKYAKQGLSRSELRARAATLMEQVRLPVEWLDRYPHQLSGGQRQRVGIARAVSTKPHLLIADEPTSALDVSVQRTVLELFAELQRELQFSCLFITHDLPSIEAMTDRTIVLKAGEIIEMGDTPNVLANANNTYAQTLIASVPIPDPVKQRERRAELMTIRGGRDA